MGVVKADDLTNDSDEVRKLEHAVLSSVWHFKAKALVSMKTTVDTLGTEIEKSKGYIARAEGQAQAALENSSGTSPFSPVE